MDNSKRKFLKLAGSSLLVFGGAKAFTESTAEAIPPGAMPPENALKGSRWAMVIDIRKCASEQGCTKCTDVCHSIHNVPKFDNKKDEIQWVWKEKFAATFPSQEHENLADDLKEMQTVVLCNHCDNPACVRVCPTKSTWKRDDGVIMMDMHRCIGCRYCIVACPYGSRSFNWRDPRPFIKKINPDYPTRTRGVVEKCNFCAERLAEGKIPACVEQCPAKAMHFGDLEVADSSVRKLLKDNYTLRRKPTLGTMPHVFYII